MKRRDFIKSATIGSTSVLASVGAKGNHPTVVPYLTNDAPEPIAIGDRKQLFIDGRFISSQKGVTLKPNQPNLQKENLLFADRPWDAARANHFSSMIHDQRFRLWYTAHPSMTEYSRWGPGAKRFAPGRTCYAESEDGVNFKKPSLGLVTLNGSRDNNIVVPGVSQCIFRDPFAGPEKRYKMLTRVNGFDRSVVAEWPQAKGASVACQYLSYSPDGLRWSRVPRPFFPLTVASQKAVIWDDRLGKWVVYLRGHRRENSFYARAEVENGMWEQPLQFRRMPGKQYHDIPLEYNDRDAPRDPFARRIRLEEELPIALAVDQDDPPYANIYSMNAWKYPGVEDVYLAFVPLWYSASAPEGFGVSDEPLTGDGWRRKQNLASDRVEVQLAISRDGARYERPWRLPLIPPDVGGSDGAGQVWPVPDPVVRGNEVWLYYQAVSYTHFDFVAPKFGQGITARAIFRLDGFVSAEAEEAGGEIITPPLRFAGRQLRVNCNAGAGGRLRVVIEGANGERIPGFSLAEADAIMGNHISAVVSWKGKSDVRELMARPVRLRFLMDHCRLYSFQFRE
jgi:hypothetical protein